MMLDKRIPVNIITAVALQRSLRFRSAAIHIFVSDRKVCYKDTMNYSTIRAIARRIWIWAVILTVMLVLYPAEYGFTRLAFVMGVIMIWAGALALWWKRKYLRRILFIASLLPVLVVSLPGRVVDRDLLAADYLRSLRCFRGVRYFWGGEGFIGIDCSGLVRKGLAWGHLVYGVRTLNGGPIRQSIFLWWHDSSAVALRDGYRGWTTELFRHENIAGADHSRLKPGDLAVTADGVHVMAYLGNRTWIEADPDAHKVIEVALPSNNHWFMRPAVFIRWKCLDAT
jgi:hypothetical protein